MIKLNSFKVTSIRKKLEMVIFGSPKPVVDEGDLELSRNGIVKKSAV